MRGTIIWGTIVVLVIVGGAGFLFFPRQSTEELLQSAMDDADRALRRGELDAALESIDRGLSASPDSSELLVKAGDIAMRQRDLEQAIDYFDSVPEEALDDYIAARWALGEIHRSRGNLTLSESCFNRALELQPDLTIAHSRLAFLKRLTGRPRAAEVHLQSLLDGDHPTAEQLAWLAAPMRNATSLEYLNECHEKAPGDPLPMFGLGVAALNRGQLEEAKELLNHGLKIQFDAEAFAALGRTLLELDNQSEIETWEAKQQKPKPNSPEIHYILGLLREREGNSNAAAVQFAICLKSMPHHRPALSHLATALNQTGEDDNAIQIRQLVQLLSRLDNIMASINPQQPSPRAAQETAEILWKLDRNAEADAWVQLSNESQIKQPPVESAVAAVPKIVEAWAAKLKLDQNIGSPDSIPFNEQGSTTAFQFVDEAAKRGLNFQYFEAPDERTEGRRMFEFTGGGVGVLDFDRDGTPDLHFTNGTSWPPNPDNDQHRDALFRNLGDRFVRIDEQANVNERAFSQGVSIGDLNNDGFPDINVANFGPNAAFINNGDGTFSELKSDVIANDPQWTTSCVIADLNGDSVPDIFDVNYVHGPGVDSSICNTAGGKRVCNPLTFKPSRDRLLTSNLEGTLRDETDTAKLDQPGNGLGIAVANLDDDADLEIFIANDLMENFYWDRESARELLKFENRALLNGWAFGSDGNSQACMGIAIADFNSDRATDLFVTNYFNESNALYLNDASGLAQDQSTAKGLRAPSLRMLGFGTQPIDADRDGDFDLVVTNGDLDDFSHEDREFTMPAQLFENRGNGTFREMSRDESHDFFSHTYRGRGLAKLDWNRDGRTDFAVSHLDTPSALVTNQTQSNGKTIQLQLVGTTSSRDAIGAKVILESGTDAWQQQLTAGDGYQSSNERLLSFSAAEFDEEITITISWPSGKTQEATQPMHWENGNDSSRRKLVIIESGTADIVP